MSITREMDKDVLNAYYVVVRSNKLDERITTKDNLKIITPSEQSKKSVVAFSTIPLM